MTVHCIERLHPLNVLMVVALVLATLVLAGCGVGSAFGGKPEIERHIFYDDGVTCYVATGYGPKRHEAAISCVKTKEKP